MLQANAGRGWRDVQNILANSATLTGNAFNAVSAATNEDGLWQSNHSGNWNGGGNHIHTDYGFGMLNAYNAVRMAKFWTLFAAAATSANEAHATSVNDFADVTLPDNNATGFTTTFTIGDNLDIDHVDLTIALTSQEVQDLNITLTSADGTVIHVADSPRVYLNRSPGPGSGAWVWGIDGLRGELSAGTWTLHVADIHTSYATTLQSASLDIYGSAAGINNTYHLTSEYLTMLGFDVARAVISDTNGGTDWLDMAAVSGNVTLGMTDGDFIQVNGTG